MRRARVRQKAKHKKVNARAKRLFSSSHRATLLPQLLAVHRQVGSSGLMREVVWQRAPHLERKALQEIRVLIRPFLGFITRAVQALLQLAHASFVCCFQVLFWDLDEDGSSGRRVEIRTLDVDSRQGGAAQVLSDLLHTRITTFSTSPTAESPKTCQVFVVLHLAANEFAAIVGSGVITLVGVQIPKR